MKTPIDWKALRVLRFSGRGRLLVARSALPLNGCHIS
jgi:hypothetical protein